MDEARGSADASLGEAFVSEFARLLDLISTPPGIRVHAAEVAQSGHPELLRILESNPYTPRTVLEYIRRRDSTEVRAYKDRRLKWLEKPSTSPTATPPSRDRLAVAEGATVRFMDLPRPARGRMRAASIQRLLDETCAPAVFELIAADPKVPDAVLERLSASCWWSVRAAVARNTSASRRLLESLALDVDARVRNVGIPVHSGH